MSNADRCWRYRQRHPDKVRDYQLKHSREKRQKRRDEGRCLTCGIPLRPDCDSGHVKCLNCREHLCSY